jgi:4-diphosphocytidyl-2-C-methyl-D-erythritol kinase
VSLRRSSPCKVNLVLNILGRRPDGFHELETVMMPVPLTDELEISRRASGVELSCNHPELPVDGGNLVHRAATRFLEAAGLKEGVAIRLEKRLPLAAGLGGGSANAAVTLRMMNELFGGVLSAEAVEGLAAGLGSDVPFFLQDGAGLGTGRGERVKPLGAFRSLAGCGLVLVHPGFGVSTPWAYSALAGYPAALNGRPGRAEEAIEAFAGPDPVRACQAFYNSLEAPVLEKHPLLRIFQEFFREQGALGTLMSGSGSSTFAVTWNAAAAEAMAAAFRGRFGDGVWVATCVL